MFVCTWVFSTTSLLFSCVESYNRLIQSFQGLWLLQQSLIPKYLSLHELLMWKFSFPHQPVHLMDLCWVILPFLHLSLLGELVLDLNQFSDPMMSSNRFNFWPLQPHISYAFLFQWEIYDNGECCLKFCAASFSEEQTVFQYWFILAFHRITQCARAFFKLTPCSVVGRAKGEKSMLTK